MTKEQLIKELSQYPDNTEIHGYNESSDKYTKFLNLEPHALEDDALVICFEEVES